MVAPRALLALTVCAAAFGAVAGAVVVAFSGPFASSHQSGTQSGAQSGAQSLPPAARTESPRNPSNRPSPAGGGHGGAAPQQVARTAAAAGLSRRLDDRDAAVRHQIALELLRKGPVALAQARALRPSSRAGRELQSRLIAALDKMTFLRRAGDYDKLPVHIRLRLDLDAFATVVPEDLLIDERRAYWEREVDAVRARLVQGYAETGEESVALLELAFARREGGDIDAASYAAEARRLLPSVDAWIEEQRSGRDSAPAQIVALETQVARLRP